MTARHPCARVVSAYYNKFGGRYTWPEFIEQVCQIPDEKADIHIQSMSFLLHDKERSLSVSPDLIIRQELFEQGLLIWLTS